MFLKLKGLVFFTAIWSKFVAVWYILWSIGIFCGRLVYFVVIWYILWSFGVFFVRFGKLYEEKSGSTGSTAARANKDYF
jgi:hypothetical protein